MSMRDDGNEAPWGAHLRAEKAGLRDESGRLWPSVRAAFWEGRLGMPRVELVGDQLEILLRVLALLARPSLSSLEAREDLFAGDESSWRFYMIWLLSVGLVEQDRYRLTDSPDLTPDGRAALTMLRATRRPEWSTLPTKQVLEAVRIPARGPADVAREAALSSFEQQVAELPYVFARERVGHLHMITLTTVQKAARIPMRRVCWSAPFADERVRDDLFGWLAERVDRWEDWSGLADKKGEAALTRHLLTLLVAEPIASGSRDDVGGRV